MRATIGDVASEADVSIRTVSRVLNDSPLVNAQTRTVVQAAMDRLAYSPNSRARGLASNRSFLVGLVHDEVNALVLDRMQRGIIDVCARRQVELVIHPSSSEAASALADVEAFLQRSRVDGVIVGPPMSEVSGLPELFARLRVPAIGAAAVQLNGYDQAFRFSERAATALIARHLLALGHRRFGIVRGPVHYRSAHERGEGFMSELAQAGIAEASVHVAVGDYTFSSGISAAHALLNTAHPPSAIFASNDYMAAGVIKAAASYGIAVPHALSVVGFDDSEVAPMLNPSLTTIRRPLRELARSMTERLFEIIDTPLDARKVLPAQAVDLEFVARESTQPPTG